VVSFFDCLSLSAYDADYLSLDKYVLSTLKGAGMTSQVMTETLADLSIHVGFRDLVHAYAPRHMVAQALRTARG
jgi:hypothetical protein